LAIPLHIQYPGAFYHGIAQENKKVMYNHYHLFLETLEGNLSQGIRQLKGIYTQHINKKYQRVGRKFLPRNI
jgi:NAD-dependent SIR2 family protein deacetylase